MIPSSSASKSYHQTLVYLHYAANVILFMLHVIHGIQTQNLRMEKSKNDFK